ncbi:MAG TPA: tRNA uridine-5-carboxymethylaminomethyl(34) synthesis GTPase MnmE, partial [Burkholderiales bacterium]|nr:tRNA uridine-5-carboxymethylaminomethyl(34) synthesis GTPase MnmE [Burkholderiales bacterium]
MTKPEDNFAGSKIGQPKAGPSRIGGEGEPPEGGSHTIAAIATPPGRGGIGVVRVSGPATRAIAEALLGKLPAPRVATFARFCAADGALIDEGLALYFPTPHSYTGEDVLELHGHGGPVVLDMLLARVLSLGARPARPGEFTERAFLNGKLDLAQAEAVADLIDAGSQTAARAALRSLDGEFSCRVQALTGQLIQLRLHIEATIDFPEEEIDFLSDEKISNGIAALENGLGELLASAQQGQLLHDGMVVVLAGPPNAGKSSLLNALSATDAAIVSDVPGTTRDVLREFIQLDGMPLHVIDTAGLRVARDDVEAEGVRRAHREMARADRVLLVSDDSQSRTNDNDDAQLLRQLPPGLPYTRLRNKIDLTGRAPSITENGGITEIALSAKTGAGLELLRQHLKTCMGFQPVSAGTFMARRRHLDALRRARAHTTAAQARIGERAGELAA